MNDYRESWWDGMAHTLGKVDDDDDDDGDDDYGDDCRKWVSWLTSLS